MPILLWLARFVGSTVTLAINLVVSSGIFLLSAHLFAIDDPDAYVPANILRGLAAIWMFGAVWSYLKHGVLQRPKPVPTQGKTKPTGGEVAVSSLGCFAMLGAAAATAVFVGPWADWTYQGLVGGDATHPARATLTRVLDNAERVGDNPDQYFGYFVGIALTLVVLRVVAAAGSRTTKKGTPQQTREERVRARREEKAERPAGPSSAPRVSASGRTIDDPMLGTLRRDDNIGGWRLANPRSDIGSLVIVAPDEPTDTQMEVSRSLVQRSFEALLRASEAARPAAQANGVGLPRFTVAESIVGKADGAHPTVTMRLRCESDTDRIYEVRSTDGMQTFRA